MVHVASTDHVSMSEFRVIKNCTCEEQIYECKIIGNGITVWKGSAFDCPQSNNEITFLSSFECNNGAITAHIITAENSTYISQLTVSVKAEIVDKSISCFHDVGNTTEMIGSSLILTTSNTVTLILWSC